MVPIPEEFTYDFWVTGPTNDDTTITCLMPNGIVISLTVSYDATLAEIKEELWYEYEIQKLPLYGLLHDMSSYGFKFINNMAQHEDVTDESRRLCDVRPTAAVLIITECVEDKNDNSLNVQISHLIGKRVQEFDQLNSAEVNDFRFKMRKLGDEVANERSKQNWEERLLYHFPRRLTTDTSIFNKYSDNLSNQNIDVMIPFETADLQNSFRFHITHKTNPEELLEQYITKRETKLQVKGESPQDLVLKVLGRDEYLIGDYPLVQFQYIQDSLSREVIPTLLAVPKSKLTFLDGDYETLNHFENKKSSFSTLTLRKKNKYKSAWDITDKYTVTLDKITGINCDTKRNIEIGIQAGLFHGGKSLCQPKKVSEKLVEDKCQFELNETLHFDIQVCNIPRNAKLCFVVYEINKNLKTGSRTKKIKESLNNKDIYLNPIAWANTTAYDFKNQLKTDAMSLYLWPNADDTMSLSEDLFHPLGTVVSNPDIKYATTLTLKFDSFGEQTIVYPSVEMMINYAKELENECAYEDIIDIQYYEKLISENDSLYDIHDQDRKNVWKLRRHWLNSAPEILPKLLHCVDWDNRYEVSEVVSLLKEWKTIPVEKSLELLDYAYADQEVRSFAVKCLKDVSDDELLLYLLQFVQAIKHELFLDCDLVKFLLRRALNNQKIGHYLFWHLRSEMQVASVSVRFGVILEAYCRGSQQHMASLSKQLECLDKLKKSSEIVRKRRDKEKAKLALKHHLIMHSDAIHNIRSPLDPSFKCTHIVVEKCRVMDSKMKPLWIVFGNSDLNADDVYIIFKNGDDLRQDMLTLQMLRIMDKLWKKEGLDLRMNPYNCISMEYRIGMIEVVLNAETIANIQKEKVTFCATSAFRKGSLLAWLKDHNTTEAALKKAIKEFTLSCAGYCVATYVLGVADRHSDNIMIKKTGQLFHIDFGHILGHFKEKFGFKRERVPFVLTHDFVHVISKGQKNALEFKVFQEYCEKAFLILRKHGGLILSLFAMMISTGLPELSSEKDLNYLRETLVLSKSEEDAITHFRAKFDEALCNSWKTSMNWATHNITKSNKA